MIFYLKKISPKLRESAREVQASMGEMTSASEEAISGQRIVKIFGSSMYELKRFFKIVTRNRKMETKLARLTATNGFIIEILSGFALAAVLYYLLGFAGVSCSLLLLTTMYCCLLLFATTCCFLHNFLFFVACLLLQSAICLVFADLACCYCCYCCCR